MSFILRDTNWSALTIMINWAPIFNHSLPVVIVDNLASPCVDNDLLLHRSAFG